MKLKHYSRVESFEYDPTRVYSQENTIDKPRGFWVSVDGPDSWKEWCINEGFATAYLVNEYDVTLKPEANILHLATDGEVRELNHRYSSPRRAEYPTLDHPDWGLISKEYDGIIISPYQWGCRNDVFWYYGWDCASGVIWNIDVIESVIPALSSVKGALS